MSDPRNMEQISVAVRQWAVECIAASPAYLGATAEQFCEAASALADFALHGTIPVSAKVNGEPA